MNGLHYFFQNTYGSSNKPIAFLRMYITRDQAYYCSLLTYLCSLVSSVDNINVLMNAKQKWSKLNNKTKVFWYTSIDWAKEQLILIRIVFQVYRISIVWFKLKLTRSVSLVSTSSCHRLLINLSVFFNWGNLFSFSNSNNVLTLGANK